MCPRLCFPGEVAPCLTLIRGFEHGILEIDELPPVSKIKFFENVLQPLIIFLGFGGDVNLVMADGDKWVMFAYRQGVVVDRILKGAELCTLLSHDSLRDARK